MLRLWCWPGAEFRLPKWLDEYEVIEVEVEDRVPLAGDVVLASRADAIVRRKADHRLFVVNFKTVAQADERWLRSWEVDMQMMTELLAAERRHGHEFGGVIIEGLIKGRRMPDEKDSDGKTTSYRDSTPLLYGYKCDADPPLVPLQYSHEYTRRKGWYRFPVWKENFQGSVELGSFASPLAYWINWLPEEVVEGQFCIVPPIMRDAARIESKVQQIVAMEQRIQIGTDMLIQRGHPELLDVFFPQNEHSCVYPSTCAYKDLCFTRGVAEDPLGSGLYQPRKDHHSVVDKE